jgi:hypothetical protein
VADTWPAAGAAIAARWDHGHDRLTDGCALCLAEYAEARAWAQANPTNGDTQ